MRGLWWQPVLPLNFGDAPVPLPPGMFHGESPGAYNHYRCRCIPCVDLRRAYDRERMELVRRTEAYRQREGKRR